MAEVLAFELGDATPLGGGKMLYMVDFGNDNAGGTPVFTIYQSVPSLADLTPPDLTENKGGQYYWTVDWTLQLCTSINYKVELNGLERSAIISSPTTAIPGTTVAEAGISSLTGYEQVGAIVAKAGVECGILALTPSQVAGFDPFASTDAMVHQMLRLLDSLGRDLSTKIKAHLQREFSLTTAAGILSYAVPADWSEPVDETLWDRPGLLPLYGPISAQDEASIKARGAASTVTTPYRVQGNRITFPVDPGGTRTYWGVYVSRFWVQTESSGTGPDADHLTAATDYVLHDPELMVLGLKAKFLTARGFDNVVAIQEYRDRLAWVRGANAGARTLSLNGSSGEVFLSTANLPVTGWGL